MNAEILDSSSSTPSAEMNVKGPIRPPASPARSWRTSIVVSLGLLVLSASFVIVAITLRSHASPSSGFASSASKPSEDKRWYSLGYVDIDGGVTKLYPLQQGRIKSITARENEAVKAGDPLLYLEDNVPLLKVREAKSALEGARNQLAIAEAGAEEANKQIEAQKIAIAAARKRMDQAQLLYDKQKRFEKQGFLVEGDKETVQAAKISVELAEEGVRGEEAKLAVMEAAKRRAEGLLAAAQTQMRGRQVQVDEAQNAVKECVLRAPVDGIPLRILVNIGEVLGSNPRQPAIQFAAAGQRLVRAEVEQEFVAQVYPGQQVIIEDSVTEKECARGKVASIANWYAPRRSANSEILSMNNDNRTLECIIHIEASPRELRIGQRVRVHSD